MGNDIVNRLVVHLIYPLEISSRNALEQSQACYKNYVGNTVEDVFKKYEHYYIRVNKLEIDLGTVTPEEIPDRLYSALEKELKKYIREKEGVFPDVSGRISGMGSAIDIDETGREAAVRYYDNNIAAKEIPAIEDTLSCLLEYLKNPQVLWYLPLDEPFDIEALAENVFDKCLTDDNYLKQLIPVISRDRRIYHRFVHLVNTDILDLIIRRYIAINSISYKAIYADLYTHVENLLSRYPSYKKEVREWFFESLLYNLPSNKQTGRTGFIPVIDSSESEYLFYYSTENDNEAVYRLLQRSGFLPEREDTFSSEEIKDPSHHLLRQEKLLSEEKERLSHEKNKEPSHRLQQQQELLPEEKERLSSEEIKEPSHRLQQQQKLIPEEKERLSPEEINEPSYRLQQQQKLLLEKNDRLSFEESNKLSHRLQQQQKLLPEEKEIKMQSDKDFVQYLSLRYKKSKESFQDDSLSQEIVSDEKQRFFIKNAGLVIFNPMIPTFFRHLGYLNKEDNFKSIRHRIRAVHLLQVLTGIQSKHYDHLLQLNKIICGLDTGFPIDPVFRITKREKEEAAELLESVLDHWSILKGTSIGGFQESFIQRDGVIEKNGHDWIVHVENKSIDILLDDLPWSINLLSFPWNEFVIHVEWKR